MNSTGGPSQNDGQGRCRGKWILRTQQVDLSTSPPHHQFALRVDPLTPGFPPPLPQRFPQFPRIGSTHPRAPPDHSTTWSTARPTLSWRRSGWPLGPLLENAASSACPLTWLGVLASSGGGSPLTVKRCSQPGGPQQPSRRLGSGAVPRLSMRRMRDPGPRLFSTEV